MSPFSTFAGSLDLNLPHDRDVEFAFLAAVLARPKAIKRVADLSPHAFTDPLYARIWEGCLQLYQRAGIVEPYLLPSLLKDMDPAEVREEIACLVQGVINPDPMSYANLLQDLQAKRAMMVEARDLLRAMQEPHGPEASEFGLSFTRLGRLPGGSRKGRTVEELAESQKRRLTQPPEVYPTGWKRFDRVTVGGFHAGRLYAWRTRPKQGKTTLLTSLSYNLIDPHPPGQRKPVPHLFMSLEQTDDEVFDYFTARRMGINVKCLKEARYAGDPTFRASAEAANAQLAGRGLQVYCRPRMRMSELVAIVTREALAGRIKGVFLDYWQLLRPDNSRVNRTEHLDDAAQTLAELAKDLGIFIVTAAQANQDGETRGGDGLLMACDMSWDLVRLHRGEDAADFAYMDCFAARYTSAADIGSLEYPAYEIHKDVGPWFDEFPVDAVPHVPAEA